jgi:hypothetical protein
MTVERAIKQVEEFYKKFCSKIKQKAAAIKKETSLVAHIFQYLRKCVRT